MSFNRDRSFNKNSNFERPAMHHAVCDKCRRDCEVPFRPTSGKPVYCNDCFDRPTSGRSENRSFQKPDLRYDEQFAVLNSKLDKLLSILDKTS